MSKHTPEPWKVQPMEYGTAIIDSEGYEIRPSRFPEDARRIVACVNACAGISTDDLESEKRPGFWGGLAGKNSVKATRLEQQRDNLAAALESLLGLYGQHKPDPDDAFAIIDQARTALCKCGV